MISSRLDVLVWYTKRLHIADYRVALQDMLAMELPYGERDRTASVDQYASIFPHAPTSIVEEDLSTMGAKQSGGWAAPFQEKKKEIGQTSPGDIDDAAPVTTQVFKAKLDQLSSKAKLDQLSSFRQLSDVELQQLGLAFYAPTSIVEEDLSTMESKQSGAGAAPFPCFGFTTSKDKRSFFCGDNFMDAVGTCDLPYPSGLSSDCPPTLTCFAHTTCDKEGPEPMNNSTEPTGPDDLSAFCGVCFDDATRSCSLPCPSGMNIDCPDGMTCHPHASCQDRDSFMCGTTWDEAAATCSDPCLSGEHSKEKKKEIGQTSPGDIDDAATITTQVFKAKLDQLSSFRQLSDVELEQLLVDVKKLFDDATTITTQVFKAKLDQLSSFRQLSEVKLEQLLVDVKKLFDDAATITTQVFKAKLDQLSSFRQLSEVKLQQLLVDVKKLFDDAATITTQVFKAKLDQLSSSRQLSDVELEQLLVDVKKLFGGDETKSCSGTNTEDDEGTIFSTDEDQTQFTMDETQFGDQTQFTVNEDQTQFTIASDDQETQFSSDSQSLLSLIDTVFTLIDNVSVVVPMKPWKEYTDPTTGRKYYSNGVITTWKRPDDGSSIIVSASHRMSAIKSQLKNEKKQFQLDSTAKNNGRFKSIQERVGIKSFFKRKK